MATRNNVPFDCSSSGFILFTNTILEYMIHLLKSSPIGFWDKEKGPDQG